MDEVTRQMAISKAENIVAHVGYPNELYDGGGLEKYYEDLEMDPESFFSNMLKWNLFNENQQYRSLRQPVNRSGWEELLTVEPTVANAFYDPSRNTMRESFNISNGGQITRFATVLEVIYPSTSS